MIYQFSDKNYENNDYDKDVDTKNNRGITQEEMDFYDDEYNSPKRERIL